MTIDKKTLDGNSKTLVELALMMFSEKEFDDLCMRKILSKYQQQGFDMLQYWNRYNTLKYLEEISD